MYLTYFNLFNRFLSCFLTKWHLREPNDQKFIIFPKRRMDRVIKRGCKSNPKGTEKGFQSYKIPDLDQLQTQGSWTRCCKGDSSSLSVLIKAPGMCFSEGVKEFSFGKLWWFFAAQGNVVHRPQQTDGLNVMREYNQGKILRYHPESVSPYCSTRAVPGKQS